MDALLIERYQQEYDGKDSVPDWGHWLKQSYLPLWQLAALSVDIEPDLIISLDIENPKKGSSMEFIRVSKKYRNRLLFSSDSIENGRLTAFRNF